MHWEQRFSELSSRHEGLVAKFHLRQSGCSSDHWWRAVRTGRWPLVSTRVLRSAAAPRTEAQRVLAAVLDSSPGAILHWRSALAWLGLRGFDLATLQVARSRGQSGASSSLATVHRLRHLRPHDVVVVRGIVTETALRAIWTEAALYASPARQDIGAERVGRLLDRAHTAGLVTWSGLHEMVEDLQQRGRAGTVIMRRLAEQRPPGSSPTESRNETRFEQVLIDGGRRLFRRQEVMGGHEPIGRCDFADVDLPLAFEINSLTYHTAPTDRATDEQRYQALMNAGFTVGVAWDDDLWSNPRAVLETVDLARVHARRRRTAVIHSPACPWPHPRVGAPPSP